MGETFRSLPQNLAAGATKKTNEGASTARQVRLSISRNLESDMHRPSPKHGSTDECWFRNKSRITNISLELIRGGLNDIHQV
jgi:hypothetical protein